MAFTQVTVSHTFINGDGSAASGSLTFTYPFELNNGVQTVSEDPIDVTLSSNGTFSQVLLATDDVGTTPAGALCRVDIRLTGQEPKTYFVSIPSASPTVDLDAILPTGGWD